MVGSGERFRLIVLDVRGKSVVLFLESVKLRPQAFHAFTTDGNQTPGMLAQQS